MSYNHMITHQSNKSRKGFVQEMTLALIRSDRAIHSYDHAVKVAYECWDLIRAEEDRRDSQPTVVRTVPLSRESDPNS